MKESKNNIDSKSNFVKEFWDWAVGYAKSAHKKVLAKTPAWSRWLAMGLAALLVIAELVFGWGLPAPTLNIPTVVAELQTHRLTLTASGIVSPYEKGIITASTAGTVKTVFHSAGDTVKQGDLIALLESVDAQRALTDSGNALDAAKAVIAPVLATAAPAVITSPVTGRIVSMRGMPGDSITRGACARIATGGALSVTLSDMALAVAVGESVRVELADSTNSSSQTNLIQADGVVTERELGSATVRITDARFSEGQTVTVYGPDGELAGSGALEVDQAALVWGVSGVIRTAHMGIGDWVEAGQPLFTLEGPLNLPGYETQMQTLETAARDAAQAQRTVAALSVYAPADGVLTNMTLRNGAMVREGESLGLLVDGFENAIEFNALPEWANALRVGQSAVVKVSGIEYRGSVVSCESSRVVVAVNIDATVGAVGEVAIDTGIDREGVWVPESAVRISANGAAYVMRAPDTEELPYKWLRGPLGRLLRPSDEAIVESIAPGLRVTVTVGGKADGLIEIVSGVNVNSTILE